MVHTHSKIKKRHKKHKEVITQPQLNSKNFSGGKDSKNMATKDILERAKKELTDLTGFKSPSAVGFKNEGTELVVTIEVLEKESIPDGMDIIGTYEVRVDENGRMISYKRTDLRKRVDTSFTQET